MCDIIATMKIQLVISCSALFCSFFSVLHLFYFKISGLEDDVGQSLEQGKKPISAENQ